MKKQSGVTKNCQKREQNRTYSDTNVLYSRTNIKRFETTYSGLRL